jgi:hypothetical protein
MTTTSVPQNIKHVFVLMLENRSLDHMLGFSGITGTDAVSGQATKIQGLVGNESNGGFQVSQPADWTMPVDPCHEFNCVLEHCADRTRTILQAARIRRSIAAASCRTTLATEAHRAPGRS